MKSNDPLDTSSSRMLADLHRQSRMQLDFAGDALNHGASIKRMLDQTDWSSRIIRDLQRDPFRDTVNDLAKRIRDDEGFRFTAQAIQEAQRHRELTVTALAGTDLLDQRRLAASVLDSGILRTAEMFAKNQNSLAAAIAAVRPRDELVDLASSIVRRMDTLRFADFGRDAFPRSIAEQFEDEFASARRAAEQFEKAETEEERIALLSKLLSAVLAVMRGIAGNTRKEFFGMGLFMLLSLSADVNSLIPRDPPPGMTPAQIQMLEETHRTTDALAADFRKFLESERRLDEVYVSNLPRAELSRAAMIRAEPRRSGKALWRAPKDTLLAIAETRGRWKLATYRDPLTSELAQGWIYGNSVRMLDEM